MAVDLEALKAVIFDKSEEWAEGIAEDFCQTARDFVTPRRKTGQLEEGIRVDRVSRNQHGTSVRVVSDAPHAEWAEYGRGPVFARPGGVLAFDVDGVTIFRHSVGPAAGIGYWKSAVGLWGAIVRNYQG